MRGSTVVHRARAIHRLREERRGSGQALADVELRCPAAPVEELVGGAVVGLEDAVVVAAGRLAAAPWQVARRAAEHGGPVVVAAAARVEDADPEERALDVV